MVPAVSVIIPCYNHAHFLPEAVESIVNQTYKNWECIIVNDGSPDNTSEVAKQLIDKHPECTIRLIEKPNGGPSDARNAGIREAKGNWILPLDSDDMFAPAFLDRAFKIIEQDPAVNLVFANLQMFGHKQGEWIPNEYSFEQIIVGNTFPYSSLYKKELWEAVGGYYPCIPWGAEDWNFWIACSIFGIRPVRIHEKLFLYRTHAGTSRDDKMLSHFHEVRAMIHTLHPDIYPRSWLLFDHEIIAHAHPETIDKLETIIRIFQDFSMPYFWRGLHYERSGRLDMAYSDFYRASLLSEKLDWQPLVHLKNTDEKMKLNAQANIDVEPEEHETAIYSSSYPGTYSSRDPLQLLMVVHNYPTQRIAGTELYTYNLAKNLLSKGNIVHVLYPEFDDLRPPGDIREYTHEGLSVSAVNLHPDPDPTHQFNNVQTAEIFRTHLKNIGADLVHFHHLFGFSASALEVCAQMGIPVVFSVHDEWLLCEQIHYLRADGSFCSNGPETVDKCVHCFFERRHEIPVDKIPGVFYILALRRQFLKKALTWINALIVPTKFIMDEMNKHGFIHPRMLLIPFGMPLFKPLNREYQRQTIRFSYLGNITFVKGLDVLIQAFNALNDRKAQLNIYGHIQEPSYFIEQMDKISILNQDAVNYHGAYEPADLPVILALTDIAVIPSRSESYSFVVRECLQAGVPVIASDVGGIPDAIQHGKNGLLFSVGDYNDLAEKLRFFVHNPEQINTFRSNIAPMRSIAEDADQLESIYREVIKNKRNPGQSVY